MLKSDNTGASTSHKSLGPSLHRDQYTPCASDIPVKLPLPMVQMVKHFHFYSVLEGYHFTFFFAHMQTITLI